MLKLGDCQTEYLVTDSVKDFADFVLTSLRFEVVKKVLNIDFNVGLFEAVTVFFFFNIFHAGIFQTLLFPVKFEVNVASCCRQR